MSGDYKNTIYYGEGINGELLEANPLVQMNIEDEEGEKHLVSSQFIW